MSDTRRSGNLRDGQTVWGRMAGAHNWTRGGRLKRAVRRGHRGDVLRRGWSDDAATRRQNNGRRRAADREAIQLAVAEMIGEEEELALQAQEC